MKQNNWVHLSLSIKSGKTKEQSSSLLVHFNQFHYSEIDYTQRAEHRTMIKKNDRRTRHQTDAWKTVDCDVSIAQSM